MASPAALDGSPDLVVTAATLKRAAVASPPSAPEPLGKRRRRLPMASPAVEEEEDAGEGAAAGAGVGWDSDDEVDDDGDLSDKEGLEAAGGRSGRDAESNPEVGIITKVQCINFMCHDNLVIDFNPRVNFIVGRNGSGKSAVCAAIQMCLGIKVKDTHRGSNIRSLVKTGSNRDAILRVSVMNKGPLAFQPEKFGSKVTIERKLSYRANSSTYKVYKGTHGVADIGRPIPGNRKEVLDPLLEAMNIQVDNPIVIMDQDNSKSFINSPPEGLYKFFLRATQLQAAAEEIERIANNMAAMKPLIEQLRMSTDETKALYEEAEREYRDLESVNKIDAQIDDATKELKWASLTDRQEPITAIEQQVENAQTRLTRVSARVEACTEDVEAKDAAVKAALEEADTVAETSAKLQEELTAAKREAQVAKREVTNSTKKLSDAKKDVAEASKALKTAQRSLQAAQQAAASSDFNKKLAMWRQRMEKAEQKKAAMETDMARAERELDEHWPRVEDLKKRCEQASNALKFAREHKQRASSALERFKRARTDPYAPYNKTVRQFVETLERAEFTHPPLGPLAMHIKFKSDYKDCLRVAEYHLSFTCKKFLLASTADLKLFNEIARACQVPRFDCETVVVRVPTRRINPKRPSCLTLVDVLDIENPWVHAALLELHELHIQGLAKSLDEARRTVLHCKAVFTIEDGVKHKGRADMGEELATSIAPSGRYHAPPKYLQTAVEEGIVDAQRALADAERQVMSASSAERGLKQQLNDATHAMTRLQNMVKTQSRSYQRILRELEAAQADEPEDDGPTDFSDLQDDVRNAEAELSEQQAAKEHQADALEAAKAAYEPLEAAVEAKKAALEHSDVNFLAAHAELLTQELSTARSKQDRELKKQKALEAALAENQAKLDQLVDALAADKAKVQATTGMAEAPEDLPSLRSAQKKIVALKKQRERAVEAMGGVDPNVVKAKYKLAKRTYNDDKQTLKKHVNSYAKMKESLRVREIKWRENLKFTSDQVMTAFNRNMLTKGHSGTLCFNQKEQTMTMKVQVDAFSRSQFTQADADAGEATDVGTLSGGERSFTTLCLINALGDQIETPFRIIDEFDVFMDERSRKAALSMIVEFTTKHCRSQFVFLTPHNVSAVELPEDDAVTIYKMPDPERGEAE